jgi:hypothetical protein
VTKTSAPDYGRDLGKLEGSVDVLKALTFAVIGFLTVIVIGGLYLLSQISDVKIDLRDAKRDISSALERLTTIEKMVAGIQAGQSTAAGSLSRIESLLALLPQGPAPQLLISSEDAKTIRSMIKFNPETAYKNVGRLGEVLTDAKLLDFPDDVVERFPLLRSLRYTFDVKGQILIASLREQRIVAIV